MLRLLRQLLAVIVSASLVACTTTRIISQGPEASVVALRQSPALGDPRDSVVVVTVDGAKHEMRLTSVDSEAVVGTSLDRKEQFRIPASQIQRVEVVEINTRAVVAAVLVALVVMVAAAIAAGNSLVRSLPAATP